MARRCTKECPVVVPETDDTVSLAVATRDRLALVGQHAVNVRPQIASLPNGSFERHHILFRKNEWSSSPSAKMLREHTALIPKLESGAHSALHANPELHNGVPLLGQEMARRVLRRFEGSPGNARGSLDELLHIIESELLSARTPRVQRLLATATLAALEQQRQYLS